MFVTATSIAGPQGTSARINGAHCAFKAAEHESLKCVDLEKRKIMLLQPSQSLQVVPEKQRNRY